MHTQPALTIAALVLAIGHVAVAQSGQSATSGAPDRLAGGEAASSASAEASGAETGVISLSDSLAPLRERFNRARDRFRLVAILSPTSGGCMHGARGVLESVVKAYPNADVSVQVVWVPTLASDNEAAARKISSMFDDPRVHQYWDPNRRTGVAYTLRERLAVRAESPPEKAPLWDVAFFYPKGLEWKDKPPRPEAWVKQVIYYGDLAKPPNETDWAVKLAVGMKKLTGRGPARLDDKSPAVVAGPRAGVAEPACQDGAMRARMIVLHVDDIGDAAAAEKIAAALRAIKGIISVTPNDTTRCVRILADVDSAVTAERAVEYLGLAGYEASKGTDKQFEAELKAMRSGGTIALSATSVKKTEDTKPADAGSPVEVASLAESLEPLEKRFNADKAKVRFVALLSPT